MFASVPAAARAELVKQIPLGCMARAPAIAAATLFLLSDAAGFITGAESA